MKDFHPLHDKLAQRNTILWDFDGVLYSYHTVEYDKMHHVMQSANAAGACEIIPGLDPDEAYRICATEFPKHHDTVTGFLPYAEQAGLEDQEFKSRLLAAQLKNTLNMIRRDLPELIDPCAETSDLFAVLEPHLTHIMITHSHRDEWARPVAEDLGVAPYFEEVFGYEQFDFQNKGKNAFAVEKGLKRAGVTSGEAVFIEDQLKHLEVAKKAYPDILTVFIEGKEPIKLPDYVDIMVGRPKHFLQILKDIHLQQKRYRA